MGKEFSYKINSCAIVACTSNWTWETQEGHSDYDLWTVFGGEATLTVGGKQMEVKEGSSILLPPNTSIRGFHHNPEKPLSVINVHFDFMQSGEIAYPFELESRFIVNAVFFREVLCKIILHHYQEQNDEALAYLSVALIEFNQSPQIDKPNYANGEHVSLIQNICRKINEDIASYASLSSIALSYGYSTTYLGKLFHSVTGVSFSNYIKSARINQAKTLLRTTDLSVAEIAERLGYYDACHFVKNFKSAVGCQPAAYKRGNKI